MPRFVARRVVVEGHVYLGTIDAWPEPFRLAVQRYNADGTVTLTTGDGPQVCKHGDWICRGPDGLFARFGSARFETMFEPVTAESESEAKKRKTP